MSSPPRWLLALAVIAVALLVICDGATVTPSRSKSKVAAAVSLTASKSTSKLVREGSRFPFCVGKCALAARHFCLWHSRWWSPVDQPCPTQLISFIVVCVLLSCRMQPAGASKSTSVSAGGRGVRGVRGVGVGFHTCSGMPPLCGCPCCHSPPTNNGADALPSPNPPMITYFYVGFGDAGGLRDLCARSCVEAHFACPPTPRHPLPPSPPPPSSPLNQSQPSRSRTKGAATVVSGQPELCRDSVGLVGWMYPSLQRGCPFVQPRHNTQ